MTDIAPPTVRYVDLDGHAAQTLAVTTELRLSFGPYVRVATLPDYSGFEILAENPGDPLPTLLATITYDAQIKPTVVLSARS